MSSSYSFLSLSKLSDNFVPNLWYILQPGIYVLTESEWGVSWDLTAKTYQWLYVTVCHDDEQRSQSIILTTSKSLTKKYVTDDKLCIDVWFVIHFGFWWMPLSTNAGIQSAAYDVKSFYHFFAVILSSRWFLSPENKGISLLGKIQSLCLIRLPH